MALQKRKQGNHDGTQAAPGIPGDLPQSEIDARRRTLPPSGHRGDVCLAAGGLAELDGDGHSGHAARDPRQLVGHRLDRGGPRAARLPLREGIPLLLAHGARSLPARRSSATGYAVPAADDLAGGLRQGHLAAAQPAADVGRADLMRGRRLAGGAAPLRRDGLGCRAHRLRGTGLLRNGLPLRRGGVALHRSGRCAGARGAGVVARPGDELHHRPLAVGRQTGLQLGDEDDGRRPAERPEEPVGMLQVARGGHGA